MVHITETPQNGVVHVQQLQEAENITALLHHSTNQRVFLKKKLLLRRLERGKPIKEGEKVSCDKTGTTGLYYKY